jgi:hypothetical protein
LFLFVCLVLWCHLLQRNSLEGGSEAESSSSSFIVQVAAGSSSSAATTDGSGTDVQDKKTRRSSRGCAGSRPALPPAVLDLVPDPHAPAIESDGPPQHYNEFQSRSSPQEKILYAAGVFKTLPTFFDALEAVYFFEKIFSELLANSLCASTNKDFILSLVAIAVGYADNRFNPGDVGHFHGTFEMAIILIVVMLRNSSSFNNVFTILYEEQLVIPFAKALASTLPIAISFSTQVENTRLPQD